MHSVWAGTVKYNRAMCATTPNFIATAQTISEILQLNAFKMNSHPPC